ncbi:tetraacyldisaccharide 4'-kinase [Flexistipes sinusarabici]|uniref:tetraacyldisaccharide 4'-kinase n=1 Tax=Flexistipes sinusarabici TaxID=2352 RepID=UPI0026EFEFD8|nr:tetraacyldisaccharide 4'-kinase [Flexistipes sinusarabici]
MIKKYLWVRRFSTTDMCRIISVGNISMGGTGKTPFVIYLCRELLHRGFRVCVLSRGHKGKIGLGTNIIYDGEKFLVDKKLAADEPFLIAQKLQNVPVITGKDRVKSFKLAVERFSPDFVVMDDAFQHRKIHRDIDIVLLDHSNPVSTGFVFPFGYLREMPKNLQRADIVVFTRAKAQTVPDKVKRYVKSKPVFFSHIVVDGFYFKGEKFPRDVVQNYKFYAFSGVASNRKFFKMLTEKNISVTASRSFPDHHIYNKKDFACLTAGLKKSGAEYLITTEKDYVKLSDELKNKTFYTAISTRLNNELAFWNSVFEKCEKPEKA